MMLSDTVLQELEKRIPNLRRDEQLSRHSTMRVGGPAKTFVLTRTLDELVHAITTVKELNLPYHILGGGSNTLFSDLGYDGLVIKNMASGLDIAGKHEQLEEAAWEPTAEVRHEAAHPGKYVSFLDLNYEERPGDTLVRAESGINLTALIVRTIDADLLGLEWYGAIPGVLGGAVYNNIHGGTHFIGDRVKSVEVLTEPGERKIFQKEELEFGYDVSRFHGTGDVILAVELLLTKGTAPEVERADYTFREWVRRKHAMQPKEGSLGSTFQNISQADRLRIGAPTTSAGWLIDQAGLKGYQIGQAQFALQHANFIVNLGGATANDVHALIRLAQREVKKQFGIDLKPEVFHVGEFND